MKGIESMNKVFDKTDKKIEKILKANIYIPKTYEDAILNAFEKKIKKHKQKYSKRNI